MDAELRAIFLRKLSQHLADAQRAVTEAMENPTKADMTTVIRPLTSVSLLMMQLGMMEMHGEP